jgi:hypothetical protein
MMTEEQREEEILRLLNNTREEYHHCSFHSRGFGMGYFASAEFLMRESSLADLSRYMDVVEEVRQGHENCHFCHMKVLAYGEVMTFRRLPRRYLFYKSEYERLYGSGDRYGRDYRAEVTETLHGGYVLPRDLGQ